MHHEAVALMPFRPDFDDVYEHIKSAFSSSRDYYSTPTSAHSHRAILADLHIRRVDEDHGADNIMEELLSKIRTARLCVADVTGSNPNVLWETGFAMALRKPMILLTQTLDGIPFDIGSYRTIVYDRTRLYETLQERLVEAIEGVLSKTPERLNSPVDAAHALTLAMSTASPTYFLGPDFTIQYMNEAAVLMFFPGVEETAAQWIGRPLADFMSTQAPHLNNMPAVTRRLQIQKERLSQPVPGQEFAVARPYDIEPIILNTGDYGTLGLQKTGVAVRDPNSQEVNGWVVSFNVVTAANPRKFKKFHKRHKDIIEGRLFRNQEWSVALRNGDAAATPVVKTFDEWDSNWLAGRKFRIAPTDYREKEKCFEFMVSIMRTDKVRYGLTSVEHLEEWFFDYGNTEYIVVTDDTEQHIIALCRLSLRSNLAPYKELFPWVQEKILIPSMADKEGKETYLPLVADAGAYIHPGVKDVRRRELLLEIIGHAVAQCDIHVHSFIYAQVPANHWPLYRSIRFEQAGSVFPGGAAWLNKDWMPLLFNCITFREGGDQQLEQDKVLIETVRESYRRATLQYKTDPI